MAIKKIFLFIVILSGLRIQAQTKLYEEQMKKNLQALDVAKSKEEFKKLADSFESITKQEKKQWLPYYYAGVCHTLFAFQSKDKAIDASCDKAELFCQKADSLSKNNSEVYVLKSMISAARILVNKNTRGQKYGSQSARFAIDAIKLDTNNPRAYLLKARNVVNTPAAAGGGNKKAALVYEQALEKYKIYKPESNLHPDWGKADAEREYQKLKTK